MSIDRSIVIAEAVRLRGSPQIPHNLALILLRWPPTTIRRCEKRSLCTEPTLDPLFPIGSAGSALLSFTLFQPHQLKRRDLRSTTHLFLRLAYNVFVGRAGLGLSTV